NIAYAGIDRMLRQAMVIGREGSVVHVTCARFGDDLVLLADHDPRYDWVLPVVRQRLREELAELRSDTNPAQTQFVDLARGDTLRVLGFELRRVKGSARVQITRLEESGRRAPAEVHSRWHLHWHFPRLELVRRYWNGTLLRGCRQLLQGAW